MMAVSADDTVYTESQLNAMTKAELLSLCSERGITGVSDSDLKAEIIAAIMAEQEGAL